MTKKGYMKKIYYTKGQALAAAREFAASNGAELGRVTSVDNRDNNLEEDDHFTRMVSLWSGEMPAREVVKNGERIGVFAWWQDEDEIELPFRLDEMKCGAARLDGETFLVDNDRWATDVYKAFQANGGARELTAESGEFKTYAEKLGYEPEELSVIYVAADDDTIAFAKA